MRKWIKSAFAIGLAASTVVGGVFYKDGETTLHFAFEGSPNPDRPIIRPPAFYRAEDGFGFVDSPTLRATGRGCTAPKYFRFDVNLPEGNYDVSIIMGGAQGESVTTIKAEAHRAMLLDARAAGGRGGQSTPKTFTINIRRGGPAKDAESALDFDGRLNLQFIGTNPSMMKLDIKPNTTATTVYLAGDSTVANHEKIPQAGWGQMLPLFFKASEVAVANHAVIGATAQSFVADRRLEEIAKTMKAGDYLFVQFSGDENNRQTDAAAWKKTLQTYIDEARKRQATPVLIAAPPPRLSEGESNYSKWTRELAAEQKVALIDLYTRGSGLLAELGPTASVSAYVADVNLNPYGALEIAKMAAIEIREKKLDLASKLVDEITLNPEPAHFPASLGYDHLQDEK